MSEFLNIDLTHDDRSVCLMIVASKSDDSQVGELFRGVSRAFADTERVTEDWMHVELERQVKAFEDATHFKFVWERSLWGKAPPTLSGSRTIWRNTCLPAPATEGRPKSSS